MTIYPGGMRSFTRNRTVYIVTNCTAIPPHETEKMRQNALFVYCDLPWKKVEKVVFGYDMPKGEDDFDAMCADSDAWETEINVIRSVLPR